MERFIRNSNNIRNSMIRFVIILIVFSCVPAQPLFKSGNPDRNVMRTKVIVRDSDSTTVIINNYWDIPVDTVGVDTTKHLYYDDQSN